VTGDRQQVLIGVPAWRATQFLAETVRTILAQTYPNFVVLISIDGNDRATYEVCASFESDPRVKVVLQPKRLGWVRNTAFLHRAAIDLGADYCCIQPHDDLMEPQYVQALVEAMQERPAAAVVYTDIGVFGLAGGVAHQDSVTGPALLRLEDMIRRHYSAVAYRGLTRVSALSQVAPMSGNTALDFAADTIWMTRLATVGELIRLPQVLYRKRIHTDNTHLKWNRWGTTQKLAAWKEHCLGMLREALAVAPDTESAQHLLTLSRERFLQTGAKISPFGPIMENLRHVERKRLAAAFERDAAGMIARA